MDIADVKASAAVDAGSSAHQFFEKDVVPQSDVEDTVDRELFKVLVELSLSSREAVKNDSLWGLRLLDLLVDNLDNNFVTDEAARFNYASNGFDKSFIEATADGALENFSDLITSGDVIVSEILA